MLILIINKKIAKTKISFLILNIYLSIIIFNLVKIL